MTKPNSNTVDINTLTAIRWPKRVVWRSGPPAITPQNFDMIMEFAIACGAELDIKPDSELEDLRESNRQLREQNEELDRRASEYADMNDHQALRIASLEAHIKRQADRILQLEVQAHAPSTVAWASYHGNRLVDLTADPLIAGNWIRNGGNVRELNLGREAKV